MANVPKRPFLVSLAVLGAALTWPVGPVSAQEAECDFPQAWANAVSWTGTFSMKAHGQGAIAPNGSYSVEQTVSGTVNLDRHEPLAPDFSGTASFTVSVQEHYEVPDKNTGKTAPITITATGAFTDFALLAFDLATCKFYLKVAPTGLPASYIIGDAKFELDFALGPVGPGAVVSPMDFGTWVPIPTDSLPALALDAKFSAWTFGQAALDVKPVDWEIVYDLTPKICQPLAVPLIKQTTEPWRWDTYDKYIESAQILLPRTTNVSTGGKMELLKFPIGVSQGTPSSATRYEISLTSTENNLSGLNDRISLLNGGAQPSGLSSTLLGPDRHHPGTRLALSGNSFNSLQLLSIPGDPTSNMFRRVADFGCFLTSATMVLDYHAGGTVADPRNVNDWLNDQPDGFFGQNVNAAAVVRYASVKHGVAMAFNGRFDKRDDKIVEHYICSGNPVLLKVSPCAKQNPATCPHFVVATGKTASGGSLTWSINDPGFARKDLGAYEDLYWGYRLFTGAAGTQQLLVAAGVTDQSRLIVSVHPSVQLTVTDAAGRRAQCGLAFSFGDSEIPNATCGTDALQNDAVPDEEDTTPPASIFEISRPASGDYSVDIVAFGGDDFTIEVLGYDSTGAVTTARAAGTPGTQSHYVVSYSPASGSSVTITQPSGAPDGGSGGSGSGADGGAAPSGGSQPSLGGGPGKGGCASTDATGGGLLILLAMALWAQKRMISDSSRRSNRSAAPR